MAAQHFFAKAWSLSFECFSKKLHDFVKNFLLNSSPQLSLCVNENVSKFRLNICKTTAFPSIYYYQHIVCLSKKLHFSTHATPCRSTSKKWIGSCHKSMAVTCHTSFFALIGNTENPPFRPPPPQTYLFQACLSPQNLFKLLVMRRLIEEKKGENREEGILYIVHATYSTIYPPPPKRNTWCMTRQNGEFTQFFFNYRF